MNIIELREKVSKIELPMSAPNFTWLQRQINIKKHILNDEPKEFLKWPTIYACMFVANAPYIDIEYKALLPKYKNIIDEPKFGRPDFYNEHTSRNLIHTAYHLQQFEQKTNIDINKLNSIFEFGGGYGAMALLCHRLGFNGKYIIYDLPIVSLLQEYYLSNVGIEDVKFSTELEQKNIDLFIGLWSISETDHNFKNKIFDKINFDYYFMSYVPAWDGWDNDAYFLTHFGKSGEIINHLPNSKYLIGATND